MKKISLFLVFAIFLSCCSFGVMAEETNLQGGNTTIIECTDFQTPEENDESEQFVSDLFVSKASSQTIELTNVTDTLPIDDIPIKDDTFESNTYVDDDFESKTIDSNWANAVSDYGVTLKTENSNQYLEWNPSVKESFNITRSDLTARITTGIIKFEFDYKPNLVSLQLIGLAQAGMGKYHIEFYNGSIYYDGESTLRKKTKLGAYTPDTWYHVEMEFDLDNAKMHFRIIDIDSGVTKYEEINVEYICDRISANAGEVNNITTPRITIMNTGDPVGLDNVKMYSVQSTTINVPKPVLDNTTIIACTDFQAPGGNEEGKQNVSNILYAMAEDGITSADGFIAAGDYDYEYDDTEGGINALKEAVSGVVSDNMVFVQGNHDSAIGTAGLSLSGNNDPQSGEYGVFVINEDDYMSPNYYENTIRQTAQNLIDYLNEKLSESWDKPIFVVSHLPLHYSLRSGDVEHAKYIFDALNKAGEKGLNIIFLFGHNHSSPKYDGYLGNSAVYLAKGDNILIAQHSTTDFVEETLNFTYMNAGYVGYVYPVNGGAGESELTMTVFEITNDEVVIKRYSKDGLFDLKSSGVRVSDLFEPDNTVYISPQTIELTNVTDTSPIDDIPPKDDVFESKTYIDDDFESKTIDSNWANAVSDYGVTLKTENSNQYLEWNPSVKESFNITRSDLTARIATGIIKFEFDYKPNLVSLQLIGLAQAGMGKYHIEFNNGSIYYDGESTIRKKTKLGAYTPDTWYHVEMEFDLDNAKMHFRITDIAADVLKYEIINVEYICDRNSANAGEVNNITTPRITIMNTGDPVGLDNVKMYSVARTIINAQKPVAENIVVLGRAAVDSAIAVTYDYYSGDDCEEGNSNIAWLISDKIDGEYADTKITGNTIKPDASMKGKFLIAEITPEDIDGVKGASVYSKPVIVEEKPNVGISDITYSDSMLTVSIKNYSSSENMVNFINSYYDEYNALSKPLAITPVTLKSGESYVKSYNLTQGFQSSICTKDGAPIFVIPCEVTEKITGEQHITLNPDTGDYNVIKYIADTAVNSMVTVSVTDTFEDSDRVYFYKTLFTDDSGKIEYSFRMPSDAPTRDYIFTYTMTTGSSLKDNVYFINSEQVEQFFVGLTQSGSDKAFESVIASNLSLMSVSDKWYGKLEDGAIDIARKIREKHSVTPYTELNKVKGDIETLMVSDLFVRLKSSDDMYTMLKDYDGIVFNNETTLLYDNYIAMDEDSRKSAASIMTKAEDKAEVLRVYDQAVLTVKINKAKDPAEIYNYLNNDDLADLIDELSECNGIDYQQLAHALYAHEEFNSINDLNNAVEDEYDEQTEPSGDSEEKRSPSASISFPSATKPVVSDPVQDGSVKFTDMDGALWAVEAVDYLSGKYIINGKTSTTFDPNANVTRAEFIKMLIKAFGFEEEGLTCTFDDVPTNHWSYSVIASAYSKGIVNGISDKLFGTEDSITRQDMAVMAYRAAIAAGKTFGGTVKNFSDSDAISNYALVAVTALSGEEIINGLPDGTFCPFETATRAQAAKIIYMMIK